MGEDLNVAVRELNDDGNEDDAAGQEDHWIKQGAELVVFQIA